MKKINFENFSNLIYIYSLTFHLITWFTTTLSWVSFFSFQVHSSKYSEEEKNCLFIVVGGPIIFFRGREAITMLTTTWHIMCHHLKLKTRDLYKKHVCKMQVQKKHLFFSWAYHLLNVIQIYGRHIILSCAYTYERQEKSSFSCLSPVSSDFPYCAVL